MSSEEPKRIHVYVDLKEMKEDEHSWYTIHLYHDPDGQKEWLKPIRVRRRGAIITFKPVSGKPCDWTFWNLTIHPLGKPTAAVDLDWYVTEDEAVLHDTTPRKGKRKFSYTLALLHKNGTKYYLDPRLVNRGGG